MNKLKENTAVCCVCNFFKKIAKYTVRGSYTMDIGIYGENETEAECKKKGSGDINCKLLSLLAMMALMVTVFAAMGAVLSVFKKK